MIFFHMTPELLVINRLKLCNYMCYSSLNNDQVSVKNLQVLPAETASVSNTNRRFLCTGA